MKCKKYELLISRSMDNDLDMIEKEELNSHIDKCSGCSELYEKYNKLRNKLSENSEKKFIFKEDKLVNPPFAKKIFISAACFFAVMIITSLFFYYSYFSNSAAGKTSWNIKEYPGYSIYNADETLISDNADDGYMPMDVYFSSISYGE
jgi:predicted anti-sigma-YlaC factor YlaD